MTAVARASQSQPKGPVTVALLAPMAINPFKGACMSEEEVF
jgi:hypothetical protein